MAPFDQPSLNMVIEPENYFRFRYESEPGSHGGLQGKNPAVNNACGKKSKGIKYFPTVKLTDYHETNPVIIRVSLYTVKEEKHVLELKGKNARGGMCYQDLDDNNTAKFTNLTIMCKKKENVYKLLMDKKIRNLKHNFTAWEKAKFQKAFQSEVKKEAKEILNTVKLCFEAFLKDNENVPLCDPLFSEPIYNLKSTEKGGLTIHRISHYKGSCKGGEDMMILCDKVQKDTIKVVFYELDENSNSIVWKDFGTFATVDVHYQVAIAFKTPPYRQNIDKIVKVCLMRYDERSKPVEFRYVPDVDLPQSRGSQKLDMDQSIPLHNHVCSMPFPSSSCSVTDAQSKWKGLISCVRVRKMPMTGLKCVKKKKLAFLDLLSSLDPHIQNHGTASNMQQENGEKMEEIDISTLLAHNYINSENTMSDINDHLHPLVSESIELLTSGSTQALSESSRNVKEKEDPLKTALLQTNRVLKEWFKTENKPDILFLRGLSVHFKGLSKEKQAALRRAILKTIIDFEENHCA